MKTISSMVLATILLGTTSLCNAQSAPLMGSKHDFSTASHRWNYGTAISPYKEEICLPCHAPHVRNSVSRKSSTGTMVPLWNHRLSNASYTLYPQTHNTWKKGTRSVGIPDGSSKLCLSCHDGTVALADYSSNSGSSSSTIADINGGAGNVGIDLSTTHPVSFVYDASLANNNQKLWDPTITPSGVSSGTIDDDMLENHEMQCTSCHDPHNSGVEHFLIKSNVNSSLCLTCHKL